MHTYVYGRYAPLISLNISHRKITFNLISYILYDKLTFVDITHVRKKKNSFDSSSLGEDLKHIFHISCFCFVFFWLVLSFHALTLLEILQ